MPTAVERIAAVAVLAVVTIWLTFATAFTVGFYTQEREYEIVSARLDRTARAAGGRVTSVSGGFAGRRDRHSFNVNYQFTRDTRQIYTGTLELQRQTAMTRGSEINVEYDPADPFYNRIRGYPYDSTGHLNPVLAAAFGSLFMVVGLAGFVIAFVRTKSPIVRAIAMAAPLAAIALGTLIAGRLSTNLSIRRSGQYTVQIGDTAVTGQQISAAGPTGPVSIEDGVLTIGLRRYGRLQPHAHVRVDRSGVYINNVPAIPQP